MYGFHGCYWRFDLGTGTGERIPIPEGVLRRYLGGVGLGAWLLERNAVLTHEGVDALPRLLDLGREAEIHALAP